MDSKTGLVIQFTGIFLVAVLTLFLQRSLKSPALRYWTCAWLSLSLALLSLYFGFSFANFAPVCFAVYFLCEYAFGFLIIAGARSYASGAEITWRNCVMFVPFALLSFFLPFLDKDFNRLFIIHSLLLAVAFTLAFRALKMERSKTEGNFGWGVMRVALALLALDFYHYFVVFALNDSSYRVILPENYLEFNSIYDLVLDILLGFGMVIVLLEKVQLEITEANESLRDAHDRLEQIANTDPLTEALTRHAFHNFVRKSESIETNGCVGVLDIDNLKPINDLFGHAAGDSAIRAVAGAVRSLIRPDDLLFRWGGDEFFVLMFGIDEQHARMRMNALSASLSEVNLDGLNKNTAIFVSFGFAGFNEIAELEQAIKTADREMYRIKQEHKQTEHSRDSIRKTYVEPAI